MSSFNTPPNANRFPGGIQRLIPPLQPATWVSMGVGALLGLLAGLLIAWVIWPVQWTNAWPADLSQEARAQYLAAVAEAYVYYGDDEAAEIARNRLFNLEENLGEEIAAAQNFFAENPRRNSRVYISNLGQLAQALNAESPDIIVDAPAEAAPAEGETASEGAPAAASADQSAVGESVRAWVNWILTFLAALLLIGGGLYVIARLNQRRLAAAGGDMLEEETPGGFDDDDVPQRAQPRTSGQSRNPFMRPTAQSEASRQPGAANRPRRPAGLEPGPQTAGDDYGFEEDDDDDVIFSAGKPISSSETFTEESSEAEYRSPEDYASGDYAPAPFDESTFLETTFEEDRAAFEEDYAEGVEDEETSQAESSPFTSQTERVPDLVAPDLIGSTEEDEVEFEGDEEYADPEEMEPPAAEDDAPAREAVQDEAPPFATPESHTADATSEPDQSASGQVEPRGKGSELRTLGTYTVHYQAGLQDYDQSYSIMDAEDGRYIGEVGMGINIKNGILQNNPDAVIALDVWLVDKQQPKTYSSQNRVLFSEYVIDHNMEQAFSRERPNDPGAIVPQAGTSFQLKGPSLILDCHVAEAEYVKEPPNSGIFQNLLIEMTVLTRD